MRSCTWQTREIGERVERQVHLSGRSAELVPLDVVSEVGRQCGAIDKGEERLAWIEARRDRRCGDLLSAVKHHSACNVVAYDDAGDRGVCADRYPRLARGHRDCFRDRTRASARQTP